MRVSEATGADIEQLGLERGHRTLVITRKGYKTKSVTIDGDDTKVTVTLESAFGPPPRQGGGAAAGGKSGIDDVGDPFAKKH